MQETVPRGAAQGIRERFVRFLVVGGLSTALNYGVFLGLLRYLPYLLASPTGYLSGLVLGYWLNRVWAFESRGDSDRRIAPFLLVYLGNLAISQVLLFALVEHLGVPETWANLPALVYTTLANFAGLHWFVFREGARTST